MPILLSTILTQADALIEANNTEYAQLSRQERVKDALDKYSEDIPDLYAEDVTGNDTGYYKLSNSLTYWRENFSNIMSIEYPAATIASNERPQYLFDGDWRQDYLVNGDHYLYLPNHSPASTEEMRILYSRPYLWTESTSTTAVSQTAHGFSEDDYVYLNSSETWVAATERDGTHIVSAVADVDNFTAAILQVDIPTQHFWGFCNLVACFYCRAIAAKYSRTNDATIAADSVAHTTRAPQFREQADEFCAIYRASVGLPPIDAATGAPRTQPASSYADLDTAPGWKAGRQYIFHRNR